ncbi:MAG: polyphenol oxidase family protein [Aquificae bacterium]|nr:polyphenol oxidase family protein [Aquificota bacterium]
MEKIKIGNTVFVFSQREDGNMREKANRENFIKKLGGIPLYIPNQKHTNKVVGTDQIDTIEADGVYTKDKNAAVGVLTADCMPIALSDGETVVMVHAGWRGLVGGIIQNALGLLKDSPKVIIGASARKCCYEVGTDFVDMFKKEGLPLKYLYTEGKKTFFSMQEMAVDIIKDHRKDAIIIDLNLCTICGENLFSYRKGDFNERILSIAYLED